MNSGGKLGDLLIQAGLINKEQLEKALSEQEKTGEKLGQILINMGIISPSDLGRLLETQSSMTAVSLEEFALDPTVFSLLPENFVRTNRILPLRRTDDTIEVGCVPPINPESLENVKLITGLRVKPYLIIDEEFERAINKIFDLKQRAENVITALGKKEEQQEIIRVISESTGGETSVVSLANSVISDAINQNASDIHFDPEAYSMKVRYRIDGIMYNTLSLPKELAESLVSLIKVNAGMDIAERRRPQDGHFDAKHAGEFYDFRVSTMGTSYGEKLNLRILSKQKVLMPLERLGMLPEQFTVFQRLIKKPYGIILVTGPTGSGKTTTLYSAISTLNVGSTEIITLEDPVEYNIPGIVQIQINEEAGISFAAGLRSILRLDPNIVMVGEIRDLETAKVAVEASLTGHLVFASIHTNDAASTPVRLLNLGVEPYLLASSLVGVVAQRLVRVICPNCKYSYTPSEEEKTTIRKEANIEVTELKKGKGCLMCNFTEYKGRSGVFEVLEVNAEIRSLIQSSASYDKIRDSAVRNGMLTMRKAGIIKVVQGSTTLTEVERVVAEEG
ncbi:MAG: GspE/PulE family protein [Caldisericaceae bacterium]